MNEDKCLLHEIAWHLASMIEHTTGSDRDLYTEIAIRLLVNNDEPARVQIATVKRFCVNYLDTDNYGFLKDVARDVLVYIAKTESNAVLGENDSVTEAMELLEGDEGLPFEVPAEEVEVQ